ncbi:type VII secretion protein EccB [Mycolicibacterium moriokaense]|nr:type VII secretion protein EccB [Mycolicibacterium moriokaense]
MARQPTTRLQVSGYRFLVRRMEHALVRGDIRMLHDPVRTQSLSLVAGCALAAVLAAVCAIVALLKPHAVIGDAAVVMSRDTGALYVRVDGTLHPVLNLASAQLITGAAGKPEMVDAAEIDKAKRGPLLGIPGAPAVVAPPISGDEAGWAVCDDATTTVIVGATAHFTPQDRQPNVLVTAATGGVATTYLLYDGRRAEVDLRNPGVVWALRIDGIEPRPVSAALLDAIPEAPPIAPPAIPGLGGPGAVPGLRIGTVVRVTRAGVDDYAVVLADGIQHLSEVAANLIRMVDSQGRRDIVSVSPDAVGAVPVLDSLPVSAFPHLAGVTSGAGDPGVLCAQWRPDGPKTTLWMGDSLPVAVNAVALAQGDGDGPNIDSVAVPVGRSVYVRAVGLIGDDGDTGPLYLITDAGVRYGIYDAATAKSVGLQSEPVEAPWPVLSHLPGGPELERERALVARDSLVAAP